ncbi:MAG: hypothetical protein ACTSR4_08235, partial [Candidatus Hodarchaeales archaeon]
MVRENRIVQMGKAMKSKILSYGILLTGILIFSMLTIIVFIPPSTPSSPIFPFHVEGGTLLEVDSELHTGTIWGQGFTIKLIQKSITPTHLFTI